MKNETQASFFGFYFIAGLLSHMGWPRRCSLISQKQVVDSIVLDSAVDQMIDWSASIGACRPDLALQIIATMFRANDWDSEDSINILTIINDSRMLWHERGNRDPREIVQPIKFAKLKNVISAKDLNNGKPRFLIEQYCFESLIWGLANPNSFKNYFEINKDKQSDRLPLYKKMNLEIESIPTLDQTLKSGEEILRGYEKELGPLSPIPQKLMEAALTLGIEINR